MINYFKNMNLKYITLVIRNSLLFHITYYYDDSACEIHQKTDTDFKEAVLKLSQKIPKLHTQTKIQYRFFFL